MLRKFKWSSIRSVLTAGIVIAAAASLVVYGDAPGAGDVRVPITGDIVEKELAALPSDSACLTYTAFRRIEDEQEKARKLQEMTNYGWKGSRFYNPLLGVVELPADHQHAGPNSAATWARRSPANDSYLALPGYRLRIGAARPFLYKDQYWIVFPAEHASIGQGDSLSSDGQFAFRRIPFRLSYQDEEHAGKGQAHLLIPMPSSGFRYLPNVLVALCWVAALLLLYLCLGLPVKVLIRLSRGETFTHQNVRQLHRAAWAWLVPPFCIVLLHCIGYWIFHGRLTDDVRFTPFDTLTNMKEMLIIGCILFAVARAFQRGLALQEEQALTI